MKDLTRRQFLTGASVVAAASAAAVAIPTSLWGAIAAKVRGLVGYFRRAPVVATGARILTPSVIAKEALFQLENNLVMGNLVPRDYARR